VRQFAVQGEGSGAGAAVGGLLGGVLGHQIGSGRGNDAATVLGAIGGAVAGHQIEKSQRKTIRYEVTVRMDDGSYRTVTTEQSAWRGGERVRLVNGTLSSLM
jgi:outer membrane lipoprotein SlyB